ncbi:MAG: response regulator [Chitinivibrionales bacterium]|nr:response regulator [Chitinivibrionales bacterium]
MPIDHFKEKTSTKIISMLRKKISEQEKRIAELEKATKPEISAPDELGDRKKLLQILIDHMPDYIFIKDTHNRFVLNNTIHLRVLGIKNQEECLGKTDFDFFPHELACRYFADEKIILKFGTPIIDREERTTDALGNELWLSTTKVPLRNDDGKIIGIVGISRDITHRKNAENERDRLEAKVRNHEKLESLGQLAGGIAHDFNNMLSAIQGFATLLKRKIGKEDPKLAEYPVMILQASKRAGDLIKKLLAFSRKGKYTMSVVDIHNEIADIAKLLEHTIDKRIRIEIRPGAQLSTVLGDRAQLQSALLNIAVNARDAMPIGGKLTFTTATETVRPAKRKEIAPQLPAGRYLKIKISDTGAGMDANVKEKIFEPFFTTKPTGKGTGLGLASVYGTIKSHKGAIEVDSEPGEGATFTLLLPSVESKEQVSIARATEKTVAEEKAGGTILLVDDEEYVRAFASVLLREKGYRVITCNDGVEAVHYYEKHGDDIDLVIIDMIMPRMSGSDCINHLKTLNPDIKIIITTGYASEQETRIIRSKNIVGFVQKPFDEQELLDLSRLALKKAD